ncbi:hypothetical protein [Amycolatopsis dendrobii]|uniref:Uncharacterized protein n=1 Tax=Amycolatopsis dendrobii TaxID=2760662 RepID=A0A7W3ZA80_9PSEU|nr:hypothetical protein [Amycolatopsis dendrobii]MBB1153509.1 hypothetical protein [Amycolatopsis dendrobii]
MIAAQLTCSQKLDDRGEGQDRFVTLVFTTEYILGYHDDLATEIPAASLSITVKGSAADLFEIGQPYDVNITEEEE